MKCLEKQRERRYASANGLARDIQRYLTDEVVEARPPSTGYRMGKFLRRNRGAALAGAAVAAALVLGLVAFAWQARVARQQRDLARSAGLAEAEQGRRSAQERNGPWRRNRRKSLSGKSPTSSATWPASRSGSRPARACAPRPPSSGPN